MYSVEVLTPMDFDWAINVAAKNMIIQEVGRPDLYNHDRFLELGNLMMAEGTAFIAKKDGRPIGAIGGILNPNLFNPNRMVLAEILWYVHPSHRTGRAAYLLIKSFKELGERLADETTMCILSESPIHDKTMEKLGFTFREKAFNHLRGE